MPGPESGWNEMEPRNWIAIIAASVVTIRLGTANRFARQHSWSTPINFFLTSDLIAMQNSVVVTHTACPHV